MTKSNINQSLFQNPCFCHTDCHLLICECVKPWWPCIMLTSYRDIWGLWHRGTPLRYANIITPHRIAWDVITYPCYRYTTNTGKLIWSIFSMKADNYSPLFDISPVVNQPLIIVILYLSSYHHPLYHRCQQHEVHVSESDHYGHIAAIRHCHSVCTRHHHLVELGLPTTHLHMAALSVYLSGPRGVAAYVWTWSQCHYWN